MKKGTVVIFGRKNEASVKKKEEEAKAEYYLLLR